MFKSIVCVVAYMINVVKFNMIVCCLCVLCCMCVCCVLELARVCVRLCTDWWIYVCGRYKRLLLWRVTRSLGHRRGPLIVKSCCFPNYLQFYTVIIRNIYWLHVNRSAEIDTDHRHHTSTMLLTVSVFIKVPT